MNNLEQSFEQYIAFETLDGDNQWMAGEHGKQVADIGREFLEFPPVLQLHLRRFEFDYQTERNMKVNDRFEFPSEIDLERFLAPSVDRSKSHIYDLYGVLVHTGDVSFGHYHAYLRTTTGPQWFEFNDSWVKKVDSLKAIEDNFGGITITKWGGYYNQSYSYEKTSSAYVLVYIRRADAHEIMRPLRDEEVPEHVRVCLDQPDEDESSVSIKTKDTADLYDLEESVRRNVLSRKFGFRRKDCMTSLKVPETYESFYAKVSELLDIPVDELRIWQAYQPAGSPNMVVQCNSLDLPSWFANYPLFWVRKPANEPLPRNYEIITIYLKFFCPQWEAPLQYLGTHAVRRSEKAFTIFTEVNRRLGIPLDTELLIYEENLASSVRRLSFISTDDFNISGIWAGHSVIFEFPPDAVIPPMTFQPSAPIDSIPEEDAKPGESIDLPIHQLTSDSDSILTLEQWVTKHIAKPLSIILFSYSNPTTPIAVLRVPSTTKWQDFCNFITSVANAGFVEGEDAVLLYRKDYYGDGPESTPMRSASYPTIQYLFYSDTKPYLYFRILKGVDPEELTNGILLTVSFSEDYINVTKSIEIPVPRYATFSVLRERLAGFLEGEVRPLRFLSVSDSQVSLPESWVYENCRYVVAPELPDEVNLPIGQFVVFLSRAEIAANDYLETVGFPASMVVREGLTLAEAKPIISQKLGIQEAEFKKGKIFQGDRSVAYKPGEALKNEFVLSELRSEDTLLVVTNFKRKGNRWRAAEEAVKIGN
jgi:ubiquitin carboxyl-terminal hydrolase 7